MKKTSVNLTEGSIVGRLLFVAVPILLSQILQNLYNSVDSIVVGNCVGKTALAAVTSSNDISQMIIGFFTGLSTGAGVMFGRYYGAGRTEELKTAINTAVLAALIMGAGMSAVGIAISPALLRIVHCPADVYLEAVTYLRIYLIGIFLTSVYNVATGVLRAVGDTRTPLYYLTFCSVVNIVLDLLFVIRFSMGVAGVAIATIVSQMCSVILIYRKMTSTGDVYHLDVRKMRIDSSMLRQVMLLGLPAAVQACTVSLSNFFIQRYINVFGSSAMAGMGAAKKIDKYVQLISQSLGSSTAIFVSQNHGAGKMDRLFRGVRYVLASSIGLVVLAGIPVSFFAPQLMRIFTTDAEAVTYGVGLIRVMVPLYFLLSIHQTVSQTIRGLGYSGSSMMISLFGIVLCRQSFLAVTMWSNPSISYVYWSHPVGWVCSIALSIPYYYLRIRPKTISEWNALHERG